MSFFDDMEGLLASFSVRGTGVRGYRISLSEVTRSEIGIESNRSGSPYAPLETASLTGGSFVIQWEDGLVSRGALSRAPVAALLEVLSSAFEGRYEDPDEAVFPEGSDIPEVEVFSEATDRMATGSEPAALPDLLGTLRDVAGGLGAQILDASASASSSRRLVASSGGQRCAWKSTHTGFSVAYDSLVWDSHSRRAPFSPEEVRERASSTGEDLLALRAGSSEKPRGLCRVLLHPRVSEQFLRTFLLSNLSGAAVSNGRSRFSVEDFRKGRKWFRDDFSLRSDPLRGMGTGSFPVTDEGVAARSVDFVRGGALVTPALGLKYARRLDLAPAPLAASFEGYEVSLETRLEREEVLAGERELVLVHSLLGLHTQDAVRGEYSVLAPQGVLYRDGVGQGRVGATLNGSFFKDLLSADLALVRFPGFTCPGMLLHVELS